MSVIYTALPAAFLSLCLSLCGDYDCHEPPPQNAKLDAEAIASAVDMYEVKHNRPPDSLQALVPSEIRIIRKDPWGRDYLLVHSDAGFVVKSAGPDGVIGTADDISSKRITSAAH